MAVSTFLEGLTKRLRRRVSTPRVDEVEPIRPQDRVRKVKGKVDFQGRVVADGVADLSVAEDHSWSATWPSHEPLPDRLDGKDRSTDSPTCSVRFEGISPILEGVLSLDSSPNGRVLGLKVVGQSWPVSDL